MLCFLCDMLQRFASVDAAWGMPGLMLTLFHKGMFGTL